MKWRGWIVVIVGSLVTLGCVGVVWSLKEDSLLFPKDNSNLNIHYVEAVVQGVEMPVPEKRKQNTIVVFRTYDGSVINESCEDKNVIRVKTQGDIMTTSRASCRDLVGGTYVELVYERDRLKEIRILENESAK